MKWDILETPIFATSFDIVWYFVNGAVCEVTKTEDVETLRWIWDSES